MGGIVVIQLEMSRRLALNLGALTPKPAARADA